MALDPARSLPRQDLGYVVAVRVEFFRAEFHGRQQSVWEATRGKRTHVPGTVMAANKEIPHDLAQYVIEAATAVYQRRESLRGLKLTAAPPALRHFTAQFAELGS